MLYLISRLVGMWGPTLCLEGEKPEILMHWVTSFILDLLSVLSIKLLALELLALELILHLNCITRAPWPSKSHLDLAKRAHQEEGQGWEGQADVLDALCPAMAGLQSQLHQALSHPGSSSHLGSDNIVTLAT